MSEGVNARELSEDDLLRELAHAKEKAPEIESDGTAHQKANLEDRTGELEAEFLRRNPAPGSQAAPDHAGTDGPATEATADPVPFDVSADSSADSTAPDAVDEPSEDPTQPTNPA